MIEIKDIKKSYGDDENRTEILKGLSFQIEDGSFIKLCAVDCIILADIYIIRVFRNIKVRTVRYI